MRQSPRAPRASRCSPPPWRRSASSSRRWPHGHVVLGGTIMRGRGSVLTGLITALALAVFAAPAGAQSTPAKKILRTGWAQEPQTLNPFVDQDEEDFRIWAINYDLLVNFNPKDLSPAPGIAQSWDISPDKKTVTFHLVKNAKWSDGQPITSADVKYSMDTLGGNGALFTSYTDNVASIDTPDPET